MLNRTLPANLYARKELRMRARKPSTGVGPLTIEEFEKLPEEDLYRLELVRGWVVREPRPAVPHGFALANLCTSLKQHVDAHRLGYVLVDIGVIVRTQPRTVRGPDLAFVAASRLPSGLPAKGFLDFVPDICIEVVSPSNTAAEIREKVQEYLQAGASEVWVADPETATFTIHAASGWSRTFSEEDQIEGSRVLPGFRLPLRSLFAAW